MYNWYQFKALQLVDSATSLIVDVDKVDKLKIILFLRHALDEFFSPSG